MTYLRLPIIPAQLIRACRVWEKRKRNVSAENLAKPTANKTCNDREGATD